ncbi:hemerythrin HHE cation binding domain-containing protein [Actibacterium atlanticum]|uniref:Hemerythrin HHE cation binding domain-containing protein n=1 Tax=Actibacterium atlanticum TaxID=1461693 RepID=A0A058ZJ95_9RHOB|nr:hemerythrin domain-containing protein [Actibacterium atlanticum]KCV81689.1 hemerythrin HHE cation binding domain-containing protein [Actibacterium atlanticum]
MLDTYKMRDHDMPKEMRVLLETYPREAWDAHPGFKEKTRHWLAAHSAFRQIAEQVRLDTEAVINKDIALDSYAGRLSYFGGNLVGSLHGHHGWEDHSYFPELSAADPRFDAGLELLEQDHADLDQVLDDITRKANRVIKLSTLDETQAMEEVGAVLPAAEAIEAFLERHLADEEELAVPIILHHRLRG